VDWGNDKELIALDMLAEPLPELDHEERTRLRDVIGPQATPTAERLRRRRDVEPGLDLREASGADRLGIEEGLLGLSFVLGDIDSKVEKLAETPILVEELGEQVRRLSERMARIEHLLAADDHGTP